jgi:predicted Kef-type K+ transport protein
LLEVVSISFAFVFGLLGRQLGLPPLVGFLAAGFALNAFGDRVGMPTETGEVLDHVAHLGVLLLLFTVGLKLKLRNLVQREVIGTGLLHFGFTCLVFAPGFRFLLGLPWETAILLGIALAFSSTVLAAKVLEAKRELKAFHGRVAIGILIIQDLIALGVLTIAGDASPSPWALVVFGLPLLKPVLFKLLDLSGHDELLVLMGMLVAIVIGGVGFESVGLSGELGALLVGVLLASHGRAKELSESLWSLKEVFLVGFFLQIGMSGLPDAKTLTFAVGLAFVLPLKGLLFFFLLMAFKLRARNAFLAALGLTCYSEFGLIVAAGVLEEWMVPLAITVALSFVIAAPLNRFAHPLFERYEVRLNRLERKDVHPDEQPVSVGDAEIMVMGMGRTGASSYDFLAARGWKLIGLDSDPSRVLANAADGRQVLYADAEDATFWHGVDLGNLRGVVLALSAQESRLMATRQLRSRGFDRPIVAHAMFEDEARAVLKAGASQAYLTMAEAGVGLGEHMCEACGEQERPVEDSDEKRPAAESEGEHGR